MVTKKLLVVANCGVNEWNSRAFCFIVTEVIVCCLYIPDQATIGATIGTIVNLKWKLCSCFGKFVKLFFQNVSFVVKLVDKCQVGSSVFFSTIFSGNFAFSANWLTQPLDIRF